MPPPWSKENAFDGAVNAAASRFNVPSALIKAFIGAESSFDPNAFRPEVAINDASIGLMQILYGTARGEGYTGQMSGLYDPATNIYYGTSYLAEQLGRAGGNVASAISAYNGGWRPDIGFGAPATRALRICLRKDTSGNCVEWRNVPVGEYSNQPYVNKVLGFYNYFRTKTPATLPAPIGVVSTGTPSPTLGGMSPKLIAALVGLLIGLISLQHSRR
jgi:Transglycosylase SLT domain